jgi:hypothetical protein
MKIIRQMFYTLSKQRLRSYTCYFLFVFYRVRGVQPRGLGESDSFICAQSCYLQVFDKRYIISFSTHETKKYVTFRYGWNENRPKGRFPLRPYRTVTYRWACADWKEVYKSTYFRVYSRIKIKSLSQVNFLAYYGSTNQSKIVLIRYGTLRLKWKTALRLHGR